MINERIQTLIEYVSNGNKRAFSSKIGVSATVIENIVGKRQGKPGYELLVKIILSIENINADWLLTGRGEMVCDQLTTKSIDAYRVSNAEKNNEQVLLNIIDKKDEEIANLNKLIGKLEYQVESLIIDIKDKDVGEVAKCADVG